MGTCIGKLDDFSSHNIKCDWSLHLGLTTQPNMQFLQIIKMLRLIINYFTGTSHPVNTFNEYVLTDLSFVFPRLSNSTLLNIHIIWVSLLQFIMLPFPSAKVQGSS